MMKNKLRLISMVIMIVMAMTACVSALADDGLVWPSYERECVGYTEGVVISHNATIRTEPNESAKKIRSAYNGECLRILSAFNQWYEVLLDDMTTGYILNYYVLPNYECLYLCEGSPIYPYANAKKRIGYLSAGGTYVIIGETNDYFIINCRAAAAYLPKSTEVFISSHMQWYYTIADRYPGTVVKDTKVYTGPGTGWKNIGKISAGSSVQISYISEDWCCILYSVPGANIIGYIPANAVTY